MTFAIDSLFAHLDLCSSPVFFALTGLQHGSLMCLMLSEALIKLFSQFCTFGIRQDFTVHHASTHISTHWTMLSFHVAMAFHLFTICFKDHLAGAVYGFIASLDLNGRAHSFIVAGLLKLFGKLHAFCTLCLKLLTLFGS